MTETVTVEGGYFRSGRSSLPPAPPPPPQGPTVDITLSDGARMTVPIDQLSTLGGPLFSSADCALVDVLRRTHDPTHPEFGRPAATNACPF